FEIDDQAIAGATRARLGRRLVLLEALGEALERLGDRVLADLGDLAGQLDRLEVDLGHLGQHLDRHGELEVGALVERGDLDLGAQRRAQVVVGDRLLRAPVDRLLEHLAHDRAAVLLAQQRDRHLARPEAGHADAALQLLEPMGDLPFDFRGLDHDLVFSFEAFGRQFGDLHLAPPGSWFAMRRARSARATAPGAGEGTRTPTAVQPRGPKPRASTNSATPARLDAKRAPIT